VVPWRNWSGNQPSTPNERLIPKSTEELSSMIQDTKQHIRLVGAGHSFSPLVPTNETQMSLAYFSGITNIDKEKKQFDVAGNTFLASVGEQLWQNGLSLENIQDINTQTFAGAIATSTHGTGIKYGSMSSTVKKVSIVNGLGEKISCSEHENTDIFNAARTNIGTLGAVTNLRIQAQDKYHLKETSWMMDLQEGLEQAHALRDSHRHFEFYALPHADYILGLGFEQISEQELLNEKVNSDDAYETFKTMSKVIDFAPFMRSFIINKGASTVGKEIRTGRNYEVFGNVRDMLFNEMEYRYIKADDIWLSPFYQSDSCAISCHNFHDKDYKKYFAAIEPIFWKYDGRPHWGKFIL
jgi:FAD/FMN-containing dehydrogenase